MRSTGAGPATFELPPGLVTPAVVVDRSIVERNIATMARDVAALGIALRPHIKTHKMVDVARLQLAAGAAGITAGTLGEAEIMAAGGIDDIFIAYPLWVTAAEADRLRRLNAVAELRVGVESAEAAAVLGDALRGVVPPLKVLVEVDSGEHRTGVRSPADAARVARAAQVAGLEVRGVFTHGGHGYRSAELRMQAAHDEAGVLEAAAEAMEAAGIPAPERSAGSTPTTPVGVRDGITEQRPGTYVFGDRQQVALGSVARDAVGLAVAATIVSLQQPGYAIINAGAKMLARDRPAFLDGFGIIPALGDAVVERVYDYHGVVRLPRGIRPAHGQVVAVIPNHVCPVVNLVDAVTVAVDGHVADTWRVDARGQNG
ncbi:MAG TPA: alanine racemase [Candidatus Limnocylindria bacterium]|nr:alanine racemase [Candidatus Limnocylindria bacterium]